MPGLLGDAAALVPADDATALAREAVAGCWPTTTPGAPSAPPGRRRAAAWPTESDTVDAGRRRVHRACWRAGCEIEWRSVDRAHVTRHLFVTGGVASSLGKGLTASSLGSLLTARGLRVTMQKLDPYLNVDPGTMNPFQHGEVFVTEDGAETDLDVGHYERFLDTDLAAKANVTPARSTRRSSPRSGAASTSATPSR